MSASRRNVDNGAARRIARLHNASPYAKRTKHSAPSPLAAASADSGEIKTSSGFASLFGLLNLFRRKDNTPKSLPQIRQAEQQEESSADDEGDRNQGEDGDNMEDEPGNDTMAVDQVLQASPSVRSRKTRESQPVDQIPFPLISSKKPPTNSFNAGPSNFSTPHRTPLSRRPLDSSQLTISQLGRGASASNPSASPLKPIQDFIDERARHGAGLSNNDVQRLSSLLAAQASIQDDSDLPSAAFLGVGLVPHPSRSSLAPQPRLPTAPFAFTAGNTQASSASGSSVPHRRRQLFVGPGQGSNIRPAGRPTMPVRSTGMPRSHTSKGLNGLTGSDAEQSGKRRRVEGMNGREMDSPLLAGSASAPLFQVPADSAPPTRAETLGSVASISPPKPTITTSTSMHGSRYGPGQGAFLRAQANPTPSPVVPSPLRTMTKAADTPSPPVKSKTSNTMLNIIKTVDQDMATSGSTAARMEVEQAYTNPFERLGPKLPPTAIPKKKPVPLKKPASPAPQRIDPPKKPALPSSAQAIASSLSTASRSTGKASTNGTTSSKTSERSTAVPASLSNKPTSSSPFLPPKKVVPMAKSTSTGPFTIDDVDDDDEIMEIQPVSSKGKPTLNGFGHPRSKKPSPPPIVVEELTEEEMSAPSQENASKPSLVIEPPEPRRLGRSPSLGPYPNIYSPTIPSPLRLVSMPEEDELADDVSPTRVKTPDISKRIAARSIDVEMESSEDPQAMAKGVAVASLPVFRFVVSLSGTPVDYSSDPGAMIAIKTPVQELPKFDLFSAVATTTPTVSSSSATPVAFNWSAAGFKPKAAAPGTWECGTCMCSNPDTATKCTVCTADAPAGKAVATPTPAASVTPAVPIPAVVNNWAAAGWVPTAAAATWTCGVCGLNSPNDAVECTVCGAAR